MFERSREKPSSLTTKEELRDWAELRYRQVLKSARGPVRFLGMAALLGTNACASIKSGAKSVVDAVTPYATLAPSSHGGRLDYGFTTQESQIGVGQAGGDDAWRDVARRGAPVFQDAQGRVVSGVTGDPARYQLPQAEQGTYPGIGLSFQERKPLVMADAWKLPELLNLKDGIYVYPGEEREKEVMEETHYRLPRESQAILNVTLGHGEEDALRYGLGKLLPRTSIKPLEISVLHRSAYTAATFDIQWKDEKKFVEVVPGARPVFRSGMTPGATEFYKKKGDLQVLGIETPGWHGAIPARGKPKLSPLGEFLQQNFVKEKPQNSEFRTTERVLGLNVKVLEHGRGSVSRAETNLIQGLTAPEPVPQRAGRWYVAGKLDSIFRPEATGDLKQAMRYESKSIADAMVYMDGGIIHHYERVRDEKTGKWKTIDDPEEIVPMQRLLAEFRGKTWKDPSCFDRVLASGLSLDTEAFWKREKALYTAFRSFVTRWPLEERASWPQPVLDHWNALIRDIPASQIPNLVKLIQESKVSTATAPLHQSTAERRSSPEVLRNDWEFQIQILDAANYFLTDLRFPVRRWKPDNFIDMRHPDAVQRARYMKEELESLKKRSETRMAEMHRGIRHVETTAKDADRAVELTFQIATIRWKLDQLSHKQPRTRLDAFSGVDTREEPLLLERARLLKELSRLRTQMPVLANMTPRPVESISTERPTAIKSIVSDDEVAVGYAEMALDRRHHAQYLLDRATEQVLDAAISNTLRTMRHPNMRIRILIDETTQDGASVTAVVVVDDPKPILTTFPN